MRNMKDSITVPVDLVINIGVTPAYLLAVLMRYSIYMQYNDWFPFSYKQCEEDFGLKVSTFRTAKTKLKKLGLIETCLKLDDEGAPTLRIRLINEKLEQYL